jgi:hypothetical protein
VTLGIATDQCSRFGQKPSVGRRPVIGGEVRMVTGESLRTGAADTVVKRDPP